MCLECLVHLYTHTMSIIITMLIMNAVVVTEMMIARTLGADVDSDCSPGSVTGVES